jgi:hypothetical protein
MTLEELQQERENILEELKLIRAQALADKFDSFLLTWELIDIQHEIFAAKIVNLCRTGK